MKEIIIALLGILVFLTLKCIVIVPQANAYVIERLGSYQCTWNAGLHFLIPFIEKIASKISLKETVLDFQPQPVITKDNVTMQIDTVVYAKVVDPKLYTYGVSNPVIALDNLTSTTLRNIIGSLELDQTLTSRDTINAQMQNVIDEATDPWGIKVTRCELKSLVMNRDLQESMDKQMKAERERRESILRAEGEKKAAILTAEGEKEALMLKAQAEKEAMITKAEGEAEALLKIHQAQANSIKLINESTPSNAYLTLQSFEALTKVADGQATKIIVPSSIQDVAGTLTCLSEVIK